MSQENESGPTVPAKQGSGDQDQTWIARYLHGATLEELAAQLGISKPGVVYRLEAAGIPIRSAQETHQLAEARLLAQHGDAVRDSFLRTRNLKETAAELGLRGAFVKRAVSALVPDHGVLARVPRESSKRYTDDELKELLQVAAPETPSILTAAAYREFVKTSPQMADGRATPGVQAMLLRFGSWGAALSAAGLAANPHAGPAKQFEDPRSAIDSIATCWRDLGHPPSVRAYDRWQRGKPGHPSSALARRLLGGSWDVGLVRAWQIVHEIVLDAGDSESVVTVTTDGSASSPLQHGDYRRADETTAIKGSFEWTLPNYLAQERALRSHARIQNLVADVISSRGLKPLSPGAVGPQFDIGFEFAKAFVLVEVKSCTADNLEMQLRLALGQVLRYAHQLRSTHNTVKCALALEIMPALEWREMLRELEVDVLCEGTLVEDFEGLIAPLGT